MAERSLQNLVEERDREGQITSVIYWGDNLRVLEKLPQNSVDLIYLDPPFSPDPKYWLIWGEDDPAVTKAYEEACSAGIFTYVEWMHERVKLMHRILKETGTLYFHCDPQLGHYFKGMLDKVFGFDQMFGCKNFRNELVWCFSGGGIPRQDFPRKHHTIFRYTKSDDYIFNIQYRPYTEGTLQRGRTKVKGKYAKLRLEGTPITDWWTDIPKITSPTDPEKLNYATQKSEALLERIIRVSSNPKDIVLDSFCGCGTTLAAAYKLGRKWIGVDLARKGCRTMRERMEKLGASPYVIPWSLNDFQIQELRGMSGSEFQNWVLIRIGGERRRGADRGIDLYTSQMEPVQVKKPRVGPAVLRDFRTALQTERKQKGYIVGFEFTKGAVEEAARYRAEQGIDINLVRVGEIDKYF